MLPSRVFSLTVVWMVEPLAGVTVRVPSETAAVLYGRLSTVMLVTPVTPRTLLVQVLLSKVCPETDSVAVPGAVGLSVTVAVNCDAVHLMPLVPVALEYRVAEVPVASGAVSTSPTATGVPPRLPVVSTGVSAAEAGTVKGMVSAATEPTRVRTVRVRMRVYLFFRSGRSNRGVLRGVGERGAGGREFAAARCVRVAAAGP